MSEYSSVELVDWKFETKELSSGHYRVVATSKLGATIEMSGLDPVQLNEEVRSKVLSLDAAPSVWHAAAGGSFKARPWHLLVAHVGVAVPAAVFAVVLTERCISTIRILLPEYPSGWAVGLYEPLALVQLFHASGSAGIVLLSAVAILATGLFVRERSALFALLCIVIHFLVLFGAVSANAFELWRLGNILERLG